MLPVKMELAVNEDSTVPVRDQIVEQIGLQIASGILKGNEKMPSIRALAQKLGIHHGIINSAYKRLSEMGMVEVRHGSGVRVAAQISLGSSDQIPKLDALFLKFFARAKQLGYSDAEIQQCFERFTKRSSIKRILVVDRNPDFHLVILSELEPQFSVPVLTVTPDQLQYDHSLLSCSLVVTSLYHFISVQKLPIDPTRFMICNVEPARQAIDVIRSMPPSSMVLLISVSPTLLKIGCNIGAGLRGETINIKPLLVGDKEEISYSMRFAKAIICDIPSREEVVALSGNVPVTVFNLYSDQTIKSIRDSLAG
jgi:DNA-binding transcriptional regulator YhcF (GntR family)